MGNSELIPVSVSDFYLDSILNTNDVTNANSLNPALYVSSAREITREFQISIHTQENLLINNKLTHTRH